MDKYRLNRQHILGASLLYMALPCILFILGWVRLWLAVPVTLALVLGIVLLIRKGFGVQEERRYCTFGNKGMVSLVCTLLLMLLVTEMISFHGHVIQSCDFLVRNAIYESLQRDAWPLISNRGEYFVYYHAYWLPPALICKCFNLSAHADTVIFCWTYLGLMLVGLILFTRLKERVLLFSIILLLSGNVIEILKAFQMVAAARVDALPWLNDYLATMEHLAVRCYVRYVHWWGQIANTFNHAVTMSIVMALLLTKLLPVRYIPLFAALGVYCSPLASFALLPVLLIVYFFRRGVIKTWLLSPCTWLGCVLVVIMAAYLSCQMSQEGGSSVVTLLSDYSYWSHKHGDFELLYVRLLRYALVVVGFVLQIYIVVSHRFRRNLWYYSMLVLLALLPFIWIGRAHNEFLFKGSIVVFFIYSWLIALQWKHASVARRCLITLVVLLSSLHVVLDVQRRKFNEFSFNPAVMESHKLLGWQGHLNHPGDYDYTNFWCEMKYPALFYSKPGELWECLRENKPH